MREHLVLSDSVEPELWGRFTDRLFQCDELHPAIDVLREGLSADAAELWLLDQPSQALRLAVFCGDDRTAFASRQQFELGLGFPGIAAGSASPLVTEDLPHDARFLRTLVPCQGYRAIACLPIERRGRVAGALELAWKRGLPGHAVSALSSATRPLEARLASEALASMALRAPRGELRAAEPDLRIRCLGGFEVLRRRRVLTAQDFGRAKAVELLQLLVVHEQRGWHRDELTEALWPEAPHKRSVNCFHVAMNALRRAIDPDNRGLIRRNADTYRLDAASAHVDLWDFRRLVARATATPGRFSTPERIEALEEAHALYEGPLFGGRGPSACASLCTSLESIHLDSIVELARLLVDAQANRALLLLRKVVTLDPGREDVEQALISALWRAGRRSAAQDEYRQLVVRLKTDLDVEPLPETRRLGVLIGVEPR
ncbi:MAG: winged helix-turn-helix domain-containing protein [Deltaproteobacteria bacterium]|nr:winged helix-turn-helix domain-containing protein [Deltaproteobacteria bacterium]